MEIRPVLDEMIRVARRCGEIILSAGDGDVPAQRKSSFHDLVTRYDKAVQAYAVEELEKVLPEAGFLCEEGAPEKKAEGPFTFVIDPIDGTLNFVQHLRHSCTSIALTEKGRPVAGVVHNPYRQETFSASLGGGAFLNGRPLRLSPCRFEDTVVLFGTSPYDPDLTGATFEKLRTVMTRCRDVRRFGAAALDLCDVAAGRAGLYFEEAVSPWDYAAGALIVREAGGICLDLGGDPLPFDSRRTSILAGDPELAREFLSLF